MDGFGLPSKGEPSDSHYSMPREQIHHSYVRYRRNRVLNWRQTSDNDDRFDLVTLLKAYVAQEEKGNRSLRLRLH